MKKFRAITSSGSVTLFLWAFLVALITGIIAIEAADYTVTVVALTAIAGELATMGLTQAASFFGQHWAISDNPGKLGTILALIIVLMLL